MEFKMMDHKPTNRWEGMAYTKAHRDAVREIARQHGLSYPFHDLDKYFEYLIFGKPLGTKIHQMLSDHHYHDGDIKDKKQAAIDWESARFTKPDKQLTPYETWKKFYPDVDMEPTLRELGFWPEDEKAMMKNFARIVAQLFE